MGREGRAHPGDTQEEEGILVKCGERMGDWCEPVWRDFRRGPGVDALRHPNVN